MIKNFKEHVEITPNNTTGVAGDTSSNINDQGYLTSNNDNTFGINFTPKNKEKIKSYKNFKRKKKEFRKNKKYHDKKI